MAFALPFWKRLHDLRHAGSLRRGRSRDRWGGRRERSLHLQPLEERTLLTVCQWDGGGDDDLWTTDENWVGDVAPSASDSLVFSGTTRTATQNDYTAGTTFASIEFAANGFSLAGNSITLTSGITVDSGVTGSTISLDIAAGAALTASVVGTSLTASGALSGSYGLTKTGSGTLSLTGSNSYTGGTTISAGTVEFASGGLGASGTVRFAGTSTLRWLDGNTQDISSRLALNSGVTAVFDTGANTVTLASAFGSSSSAGVWKVGSGTLIYGGNNTYTGGTLIASGTLQVGAGGSTGTFGSGSVGNYGSLVFNRSSDLLLTTVISGTGSVTKQGSGSLYLWGSNTYTGGTSIEAGTLAFTANGLGTTGTIAMSGTSTLQWYSSNTVDISSRLVFNGGISFLDVGSNNVTFATGLVSTAGFWLVKAGTGTLTLAGDNTYNGLTVVNDGTLVLAGTNASTGGTWLNGGTLVFSSGGLGPSGTVTVAASSTLQWYGTHSLDISDRLVLQAGTAALNIGSNDVTFASSFGGAGVLAKSGSGTLSLTAANTYTGGTTINVGTVEFADGGLGSSGTVRFAGTSTLRWLDGNTQDISSRLALNSGLAAVFDTGANTVTLATAFGSSASASVWKIGSGTLIFGGNNTYTGTTAITDGTLQVGAGGSTGTFGSGSVTNNASLVFNRTGTLLLTNVISGTGSVTKQGSGSLYLWGSNTYTGGTSIEAGMLAFTANGLGTTGTIAMSGTSTLQWYSSNTVDISSRLVFNGGISFLDVGSNNVTFATGLVNTAGFWLVKAGTGTLTLAGDNTYNGLTVVNDGTLVLAGTNASTGGTWLNGGKLAFSSGGLGPSGPVTVAASSTLQWYGSHSLDISDRLVLQGGTATLDIGSNNVTFASSVSGEGTLAKSGSGTLSLTAANTYTGGTTLNAGTVEFASGGLNTSGTVRFAGASTLRWLDGNTDDISSRLVLNSSVAATLDTGANTVTLATAFGSSNSASVRKAGSGTLIFTGNNAYNGTTTILAGTLQVGAGGTAGKFGSGSVVNNASLVFNRSNDLSVGNVISGTGSVTKRGGANLYLTGTNTYTGGTFIEEGSIAFTTNGLGTSGAITLSGLSGLTWYLTNTVDLSSRLVLNGIGCLNVGSNNVTFASPLGNSGSIWLVKFGTGALTLTADNDCNGIMQIEAGTLQVGNGGTTGSFGGCNVVNKSALVFNRSDSLTVPGAISNAGTLAQQGSGTVILTGDNSSYTGTTTISAGTLQIGDGGTTGTLGTGSVVNTSALVFDRSDSLTVTAAVSGAGTLTQQGTGTLILSGTKSYTGATTVNQGNLQVTGSIASSAVTVNTGGTLSGTGSTGAVTANGGILAPGVDGVGTINTKNLAMTSDSSFNAEIAAAGADQANVTGTVSLGAAALNLTGTRAYQHGSVVVLVKNDSADAINGTFFNLPEGAQVVVDSVTYSISYVYNAEAGQAGTGNDVALITLPQAVKIEAVDSTAEEAGAEEAPDPGQFVVTRYENAALNYPLTVSYSISGTATNGSDYTSLSGSVTIPAGSATAPIDIEVINDSSRESAETVTLTLTGTGYTIGTPSSDTVTIEDNDQWSVSLEAADPDAIEARVAVPANTGYFTIARFGETDLTHPLEVQYTIAGTAINGTDYQTLTGSATIPAGSDTVDVIVTPLEDTLTEGDETVTLTLAANAAYTVSELASDTVTIADDPSDLPFDPERMIGEFDQVTVTQAWQPVTFRGTYQNPVVIAQPASYDDTEPATVRIRNVTSTGFEINIDDWDESNGVHGSETIAYLVVEKGLHVLEDGTTLIAGTLATTESWATERYPIEFNQSPVLLTQAQTYLDQTPVVTRQRNATADGFEVRLQEAEAQDGVHPAEIVGYLAIEVAPIAENVGIRLESNRTAAAVTHDPSTIAFTQAFRVAPMLLASVATVNDLDPVSLRWSDATTASVVVRAQEEQSVDGSDLTHGAEVVDYLALEFAGWLWQAENQPPAVGDQVFDIDENSVEGTIVGTIVATDANLLDRLSYEVTAGNESGAFTIDQESGAIAVADSSLLNHEVQDTYVLSLLVTDSDGLSDTATITILVNDVSERPVVANHTFTIDENSATGTVVGTVPATDPDAGQTVTLSILTGNEDGIFAIDPASGQITVANGALVNYEALSVHHLTVQATDNDTPSLSSTATVTIRINDLNEAPGVLDQTFTVAENSPNGTLLGRVVVAFLDAGETASLEILSGNEAGVFALNAQTGALTVADSSWLDFENQSTTYSLAVRVTDSGTPALSSDATITIHIADVNEAPAIEDQTFHVDENSSLGTTVGSVVASDPDAGDTLRYAITAGNYGILGPGVFAINPTTGVLSVADSRQLNHEVAGAYELVIQVVDSGTGALKDSALVTVVVDDVNEAPVLANDTFAIGQSAQVGTLVGTAVADDPDANDTLSYSITAGNGLGLFSINAATGEIRVAAALGLGPYALTVQAADAGSLTDSATMTIQVEAGATASITLLATIRDFKASHPDFEDSISNLTTGLVASTLGEDGKPSFVAAPGTGAITSAETFNQWYNDVSGINLKTTEPLTFAQTGPNEYEFYNQYFWPIDGELWATQGEAQLRGEDNYYHNFHFTMEIHTTFTYRAGGQVFDVVEADDDLWVYINNQLVIDIGGVHSPTSGSVNLDAMAAQLGLVDGETYPLDLFFAERHTVQSHLRVSTTIEDLTPVQTGYQMIEEDRLRTDDAFVTGETMTFFVPENPVAMAFSFEGLVFDTDDPDSINDAFELALVDEDGNSLVPTITAGSNAFFNLTEGEASMMAEGVGMLDANTVVVDISNLVPGIQARLVARLINNDGVSNGYDDQATHVWITEDLTLLDAWPLPVALDGAFLESDGQVVVEAEHFTGWEAGSSTAVDHRWNAIADAEASGETALQALSNSGVDTGNSTTGPRRDYALEFSQAGTYYVWVRMKGATTSDNAINLGLNGTLVTTGGLATTTTGAWEWVRLVGGSPLAVTVATPGVYTLNLWMREDGAQVDKILLTTDSTFTPTNLGPSESDLDPVPPVAPPDLWEPKDADFDVLSDVTAALDVAYTYTSLNDATNVLYAGLTLTSNGLHNIRGDQGPLLLGVIGISDPTVTLFEPDGVTPDGIPYYDISSWAFTGSDDRLVDGDVVQGIELKFLDPDRVQFSYELVVLGALNRAPEITSVPVDQVNLASLNNLGYSYEITAVDPDGDALSYTLLDGPAGMSISAEGVLQWSPNGTAVEGNYHISIVVTDTEGASSEPQSYVLQVVDLPNHPPLFTSTPVVDAYAGAEYQYQATALDTDGDALNFEDATGTPLAGFAIDSQTGLVTWTPPVELVGQTVTVTLRVEDRPDGATDQLYDEQTFQIYIHPNPLNHDPVIVSEPSLHYTLPGESSPASGDVTPTSLDYDLDPGEAATVTVSVTVPIGSAPELGADIIFVVDESGSMAGEHDWLDEMVLVLEGILAQNHVTDNRYGLVGYGRLGNEAPRAYLVGGGLFGSAAEFALSTTQLITFGGTEDGWYGIDYALNTYDFREGAAVNIILVTDEDRDVVNGSLGYESVLNNLLSKGAVLNVVVDAVYKDSNQVAALGVDADGYAYVAEELGGYSSLLGYTFSSDFGTTHQNYSQMAWETGGAAWNLNQLRAGGDLAQSFTKAFVNVKAEEIESSFAIDVIADSPIFTNLTGQLVGVGEGEVASFDIQLLGDGQAYAFDLTFVRAGTGLVLGSIPVTINAPQYVYDVDALDPDEGDVLSYTFLGDTYGAQIDSATGLMTWNPFATGNYKFTVEVTDGQGGVDTQSWTVAVGTTSDGNHDPAITSTPATEGYAGQPYQYQVTATDPDGDPLSYYLIGTPPEGMAIDAGTGILSWDDPSYGTYEITVRVADGRGGYGNQTFELVIGDRTVTNRDPSINSTPTTAAVVDELYRYQVRATDPDADPLTYDLVSAPDGMAIDAQTGLIAWMPGYLQTGAQYVVVRVRDGWGGSDVQAFGIEVTTLNTPPQITSWPYGPAGVGVEWTYQITAEDANGDVLSYRLDADSLARGMTIDAATGLVNWTPTTIGEYCVYVWADDGRGGVDQQGFILEVSDNAAPQFSSTPTTVVLVGNEYTYAIVATDPNEGDTVTLQLDQASIERGMAIDATNTLRWTSQVLGSYEVRVTAADNHGASRTQIYTLRVVEPASNAPVITSAPTGPAYVDQQYIYELAGYDPDDGDTITFALSEGPAASAVNLVNGQYVFTWTPTAVGTFSISIVAEDNHGVKTYQMFDLPVVTVPATNDPPAISSVPTGPAYVGQEWTYEIDAYDPNGDAITLSLDEASLTRGMTLSGNTLSWTPSVDGGFEVRVRATDEHGAYLEQSFTLPVVAESPANGAPTITSHPTGPAYVGQPYTYWVVATDPDGDAITYSVDSASYSLGVRIDSAGQLTWTPGTVGEYLISVRAEDTGGAAAIQQFRLPVVAEMPANDAPVISSLPSAPARLGELYEYQVVAYDPNGDELTYILGTAPTGATLSSDGLLTFLPEELGTFEVKIIVQDAQGAQAIQTFQLPVVTPASGNQAPVITSTPLGPAAANLPYRYQVTAEDPNGDTIVFSLDSASLARGATIDSATGLIVWTPTAGGTFRFVVTASDGLAACTQTFDLPVVDNAPPRITSTPVQSFPNNTGDYTYQVVATDANPGDEATLVYSLTSDAPGMTIDSATGLVTWSALALGVFEVQVKVTDDDGAWATQTFSLQIYDPNANRAPTINTFSRTIIQAGQTYLHQIDASDADGDSLTYVLESGPDGLTLDTSGMVRWVTDADDINASGSPHTFVVHVEDGREGVSASVTFSIDVILGEAPNSPPQIESTPLPGAAAGQLYKYQPAATDPDGDVLSWSLDAAPTGMTIDSQTGYIAWTPVAAQLGQHTVTLRVTDTLGAWATQTYLLTVQTLSVPPRITSVPETLAVEGEAYTYKVTVTDDDTSLSGLAISLLSGPSGMVASSSGAGWMEFTWTPPTGSASTTPYVVEVQVSDGQSTAVQRYGLVVTDDPANANKPPMITSVPLSRAASGDTYSYQVTADDENPATLTYSRQVDAALESKITINSATGLLTWNNVDVVGSHTIVVIVTDSAGLSCWQTYTLVVGSNTAPTISSVPITQVTAGTQYRYNVVATDPDLSSGDSLSYRLDNVPTALADKLTIDQYGRIRWLTTTADAGSHVAFSVVVTDSFGKSATQAVTLNVVADTQAPVVSVSPSASGVYVNGSITFYVSAIDNVGVVAQWLHIYNVTTQETTVYAVDSTSKISIWFTVAGDYQITATASDAAGNVGTSSAVTITVVDPSNTSPIVTINTPGGGMTLSQLTDVIGTIDDPNDDPVTYTVVLVALDAGSGGATTHLGTFSGERFSESLGATIDPSLLADGSYRLEVTATDGISGWTTASSNITIQSDLKLGNFALAFTDMTIPVAGMSITVLRSYDTYRASTKGDFGYGWQMELANTDVEITHPYGTEFVQDSQITIKLPDGTKQTFLFQPEPQGISFYTSHYLPAFVAANAKTTSTLTADSAYLLSDGCGGYVDADTGSSYDPTTLTLKTYEGVTYVINAKTGKLKSITDRNGNKLTFTTTGIVSSSGTSVKITRDTQGRITKITDPSGGYVKYTYNSKGDLVSFTNRVGDSIQFVYDETVSRRPHYLTEIIDARGVSVLKSEYDANTGQLTALTDALNNTSGYTTRRDLGDGRHLESVTDAMGVPTERVLDDNGNVLRLINRLADNTDPALRRYQVTVYRYNANDYQTHESMPFEVVGDADKYDYEPSSIVWKTAKVYDTEGNVLRETDARGNVTNHKYDSYGRLVTTTDSLGNITSNTYDSRGNLTQTVDANGVRSQFSFDSSGRLSLIRDASGNTLGQFSYDSAGNTLIATTLGGTGYSRYDAAGNQTLSYYHWTNPSDSNDTKTIVSRTDYDREGRVVATRQYILSDHLSFEIASELDAYVPAQSVSTTYDAGGHILRETDAVGNTTENVYDVCGLAIETRTDGEDAEGNPVVLVTRTVYDANGRATVVTRPYVEGQSEPIYATRSIYDELGRVVVRELLSDVEIQIAGTAPYLRSEFVAATVVSSTQMAYDVGSRVTCTVDQYGRETHTTYNAFGEMVEVRTESVDAGGNPVWLVSRTVYDSQGRVALSIDQHVQDSGDPVLATRTIYDQKGRVVGTVRLQGVQVTVVNGDTVVTDYGTELWRTETIYDSTGRVQRAIGRHDASDPNAPRPTTDYEYDSLGRQVAQIGPVIYDAQAGEYVRHRTETKYVDDRTSEVWTNIRVIVDVQGNVLNTIYANRQVTAWQYDSLDQPLRETQSAYSNGVLAISIASESRYDEFGRVIAESESYDALTQTVVWSEQDQSYVDTTHSNSLVSTKRFMYDALNRLSVVILPEVYDPDTSQNDHPTCEYNYDAQGNQVAITDPLGRETQFAYDAQGRQTSRTLCIGVSTAGDPDDFVERKYYDDLGRLEYAVSFEGVYTRYTYDDIGRLQVLECFADSTSWNGGSGTAGQTTTYTYDAFGRVVVTEEDTNGTPASIERITTNAYNTLGQVLVVASPEGTIRYEYDVLTGLLMRTYTGLADDAHSSITSDGKAVTDTRYGYDDLGRLASVTVVERNDTPLGTPEVTEYLYDLLGNVKQERMANGVVSDYLYDGLNRLERLSHFNDADSDGVLDQGEDVLSEYDYEVLANGRRSSVTETDDADNITTIDWFYDSLGRLIKEAYDSYNNALDYTAEYIYDLVGNRLQKTVDEGSDSSVDQTVDYTYDANDRLLTESKDVVGSTENDRFMVYEYGPNADVVNADGGDWTQRTSKRVYEGLDDTGDLMEETTYAYNPDGRMSQTLIDEDGDGEDDVKYDYSYAADGIRASQTVTTDADDDAQFDDETPVETAYLYDKQNLTGYPQILEEKNTQGNVAKTYTIGLDAISQQAAAIESGEAIFLLHDGHASTRTLVDGTGQLLSGQVFAYDAFGNRLDGVTALTSLLYCGEQTDGTGLQYLRARLGYDPSTGRFTTMDVFRGISSDPQSLHKYVYCHGDPVNYSDPSGMCEGLVGMLGALKVNKVLERMDLTGILRVLHYAERAADYMQYVQQILAVAAGAARGDWAAVIQSLVGVNPRDIKDILKTLAENGLEQLTEGALSTMIAVAAPVITFPIDLPDTGKIGKAFRKAEGFLKAIPKGQELLGELGTAFIAYLLDFDCTGLKRAHAVWGPDGIVRHEKYDGFWAIFEAKGGCSKLGTSTLSRPKPLPTMLLPHTRGTSVPQMGREWLEFWCRKTIAANNLTPDGEAFEDAFAGHVMLTSVVSVNLSRRQEEIKIAAQAYDPPLGLGLNDWPAGF